MYSAADAARAGGGSMHRQAVEAVTGMMDWGRPPRAEPWADGYRVQYPTPFALPLFNHAAGNVVIVTVGGADRAPAGSAGGRRQCRAVNDGRGWPAAAAREDGQAFVFVLTILLALLLLVATSINIGQAVNRRILLQMVADAGAFTGATEMARGMNTIAEQNGRIQRAWATMVQATRAFGPAPVRPQRPGGRARTAGPGKPRARDPGGQSGYGRRAAEEAYAVSAFNAEDLVPGRTVGHGRGTPGLSRQRPAGRVVELEQVPDGTSSEQSGGYPGRTHVTWSCSALRSIRVRTSSFSLWYRAVPESMPIAFAWVVTAPARRARLFDSFFGPYAIPPMSAAAVAKPIGGEIKEARARYVAKVTPLRELLRGIDDTVRERWREIYH